MNGGAEKTNRANNQKIATGGARRDMGKAKAEKSCIISDTALLMMLDNLEKEPLANDGPTIFNSQHPRDNSFFSQLI
jgi:hypothetical protein